MAKKNNTVRNRASIRELAHMGTQVAEIFQPDASSRRIFNARDQVLARKMKQFADDVVAALSTKKTLTESEFLQISDDTIKSIAAKPVSEQPGDPGAEGLNASVIEQELRETYSEERLRDAFEVVAEEQRQAPARRKGRPN